MDLLELYSSVTSVFDSQVFGTVMTGLLAYTGVMWVAVVIWVARDIVHRSNNILFQIIAILLSFTFIPGLILYLIIRPTRTLADKYDEELERRAFLESISETEDDCPNCGASLKRDFIFCPSCKKQLKNVCKCGQVLDSDWQVCPRCGMTAKAKKERVASDKKEEKKASVKKKKK